MIQERLWMIKVPRKTTTLSLLFLQRQNIDSYIFFTTSAFQAVRLSKLLETEVEMFPRIETRVLRATVQKYRALGGHIKKLKFLHFLFAMSI